MGEVCPGSTFKSLNSAQMPRPSLVTLAQDIQVKLKVSESLVIRQAYGEGPHNLIGLERLSSL